MVMFLVGSLHWSLLVFCHLQSLNPSSPGERKGSPCILHLDPIEGQHKPLECQVKSFILQAWMDSFEASNNLDILHSLIQMKYVQAKVPQQGNGYDCGLYILHYIEVFLLKSTLQDLIVSSLEGDAHFTRPNFRVEVLGKRNHVRRLIFCLGGMSQVDVGNPLSIQPMPQEEVGSVPSPKHHHHGSLDRAKERKSKKWKEMETLVLLECVVGGGRFSKGKLGAMHWDLIAEEINLKSFGGPLRSKEQCQNRFDTLLKAYKDLSAYCLKMGKSFCNVTEDEKRSLKLATPLGEKHEVWYNHLRTIYVQRSCVRGESYKRRKPNRDGCIDVTKLASRPVHPSRQSPLPLDVLGSSKSVKPSSRLDVVKDFNALSVALRYTFPNLIQGFLLPFSSEEISLLEALCRFVAIVQDQHPLVIRSHVYELHDLKLVTLRHLDQDDCFAEACWVDKKELGISNVEVYQKLGRKVLSKNPHLNTFCKLSSNPMLAIELCPLQQVRVLTLHECQEVEDVYLGNFPNLCNLNIMDCAKLKVVNGWEGAKRLGWIFISECPSYCSLLDVQFLSSLKEFQFRNYEAPRIPWHLAIFTNDEGPNDEGPRIPWHLANFSQCVQLRRLELAGDCGLVESMDLKALRFLEVLSFEGCSALSIIHGLSGLQSLIKLSVWYCKSLEMVPDLGCLKALTYLNMGSSGIVEVLGVQELHLLTILELSDCESLESLPPLGHLKALVHLYLRWLSIEEIPGVEDLVNLERLWCSGSKLRRLPNLGHLHRLHEISVDNTPLSRMEPSRVMDNDREVYVDDISDISDAN